MAWTSALEMQVEIDPALNDALRLAYISCGIELQVEAANALADLYVRANEFRHAAITRADEEVANSAVVAQQLIHGIQNFLLVWIHLKQDEANEAWNALIDAQQQIECGLRFHEDQGFREVAKRLDALEQLVFPPQVFTSPSFVYRSATCTICGVTYGDCDHLAGQLYMGRFCAAHVKDVVELDHQAIVDVPADKACRITRFQRGTLMVDKLTLRVVGEIENPNDGYLKSEAILMRASQREIHRIDPVSNEDGDTA
jgi:hypothetical protein